MCILELGPLLYASCPDFPNGTTGMRMNLYMRSINNEPFKTIIFNKDFKKSFPNILLDPAAKFFSNLIPYHTMAASHATAHLCEESKTPH